MPPDTHESDRLFAEIGRVTVRWAELEDVLGDFIASLLDDERRYTRVIATELSYQGLTNLLVSLYIERHGDDSDLASLRQLLVRADAVEQARNQIVHSTWISAGVSHVVTRVKSTAKRKHGYSTFVEKYDLDRFRAVSDEIANVRSDLARFALSLIEKGKAFNPKMGANNRLMAAPNG
jgi:hypothetical protein